MRSSRQSLNTSRFQPSSTLVDHGQLPFESRRSATQTSKQTSGVNSIFIITKIMTCSFVHSALI